MLRQLDDIQQAIMYLRIGTADTTGGIEVCFCVENAKPTGERYSGQPEDDADNGTNPEHHDHGPPCDAQPEHGFNAQQYQSSRNKNCESEQQPVQSSCAIVPAAGIGKSTKDVVDHSGHGVFCRLNGSAPTR